MAGNMTYCMMENTLRDLKACQEAMDNNDKMSEDEIASRRDFIDLCVDIALKYGYEIDRNLEEI